MTTFARIVHEVPSVEERAELEPQRRAHWRPVVELNDVLALGGRLRDAGYAVGDVLDKIDAVTEAIDRSIGYDPQKYLSEDLLDLDPYVVAERVRQLGLDLVGHLEMGRARADFDQRLARDAVASLRENSDPIIAQMRKQFDPALKVVQAAAATGLTPHTNVQTLADVADERVIQAYRKLSPAVVELDTIARLRTSMAIIANIGPADYTMMANFIADAESVAAIQGAQGLWVGEIEVVQYDLPGGIGSTVARVRRPRLGGAWLALVTAGYKLHLNTAAEADAVLAAARAADESE